MKKNIKKLIFSLALAAGIALVTAAVCSFAEIGEITVNGIKYSYDTSTHTASVIGDIYFDPDYGEKNRNDAPEIEIPSTITVNGDGGYTVTAVGEKAFYRCKSLTRITIPSSVTTIGNEAFQGCNSLQSITIPEGVTTIGYNTFDDCSGLTSVVIPSTVTTIGEHAFCRCSGLTSITIPAGVESIANDAFNSCSNLTAIDVNANNNNYSSANGILYDENKTTLIRYPEGKNGTYFTIPNTVTTIGDYAFSWCSSLTSITIPEGVTTIGDSAFSGCSSLTGITIPEGAETIGESAFLSCSSLTSITIPKRVTTIGKAAFYGCSGLTSVTIPEGVTKIEDRMFYLCSGLTDAFIPSGATIGTNAFGKTAPANVWRYSVPESSDDKIHVNITSVKNKDESDISTSASLTSNAMGENYVIDAVECCATGNATSGWTVYGVHDLEKTEAVPATCTEAGNIEYWTCSHCGKHFSDAQGTTEIAEGDWVISATGHTYSGAWWPYDEENHADWCSKCGAYKTEPHSFETIKKEADDEYLGLDDRQCNVCQGHYQQYTLKEGTSPDKWYLVSYNEDTEDKEVQEAYISDEIFSATATVNVNDDPNKPVMIILQDPLGTLGGNEIRISASNAKENLGDDYDGNYKIENAYGVDIILETKPIMLRDGTRSADDEWVRRKGDLGGYVRLLMEIPDYDPNDPNDDWDDWETQAVRINGEEDTKYFEIIEYQLYDSDGNFVKVVDKDYKPEDGQTVKKFVAFYTNHFSKYAAVDPEDVQPDSGDTVYDVEPTAAKPETTSSEKSGKGRLNDKKTGENMDAMYILAGLMSFAAVGIYLTLKKRLELENK